MCLTLQDLTEPMEADPTTAEEEPVGTRMHDRDLRSMKDALLVETSEMLGVSSLSIKFRGMIIMLLNV